MKSIIRTALALLVVFFIDTFQARVCAQDLADQVLIRRTQYGIPHIKADNMEAAGYAMGYLQVEDYGRRVVDGLIRARGSWAKYRELNGESLERQIDRDAASQLQHERAVETFPKLNQQTQDLLKGYALGVNRYIEGHADEFPSDTKADFTAYDVHAKSIGSHSDESVKKILQVLKRQEKETTQLSGKRDTSVWSALALLAETTHPDVGSNVWALAPSRTASGKAILMRNPHLTWTAGYYEAQLDVAGHFNFYGDFRIGQPLGIVGGFNSYLGWSTTNNYTDNDEIYAFSVDPHKPDHYLLDDVSHALIEREVVVEYKKGNSLATATRTFLSTPYGPVIHRTKERIYIIRAANDGEYRTNEQFLKMMAATSLEEWKDAMRMQARSTSNFTYADRDGNVFYVWNGSIPKISHPSGNDTAAVYVSQSSQIWTELMPWDELPQLLNPKGGYLRNENDPFHFTNLNAVFDEANFPSNFPKAQLRLRSQLSLDLVGGDDKLSLEEVIRRKHNMTALLAERVKADLIRAVEASHPSRKTKKALKQLKQWDNTVAKDSKGGVLFDVWWNQYVRLAGKGKKVASTPESAGYAAPAQALFSMPWSKEAPTTTPHGLGSPDLAVEAFEWAIEDCMKRYGTWNLAWGDVHRAVIGEQDYSVGGASGDLGCFRVLWYVQHKTDSQKMQVRGGDGWVLAVEFGDVPRAYSVLAYGQSAKKDSPYYADQLKLFTDNEMKPVAFTEEDIQKNTVKSYRPGRSK